MSQIKTQRADKLISASQHQVESIPTKTPKNIEFLLEFQKIEEP